MFVFVLIFQSVITSVEFMICCCDQKSLFWGSNIGGGGSNLKLWGRLIKERSLISVTRCWSKSWPFFPKVVTAVFNFFAFSISSKTFQVFGPILKEILSTNTFKTAKSGHTDPNIKWVRIKLRILSLKGRIGAHFSTGTFSVKFNGSANQKF